MLTAKQLKAGELMAEAKVVTKKRKNATTARERILLEALRRCIPFVGYCGAGDQEAKQLAFKAIKRVAGKEYGE